GFAALSTGAAGVPLRSRLDLGEEALGLTMPASLRGSPYYAVKLVSVVPANPGRGRPLVTAMVLLSDAATGETLAILDGEALTALRTGAAGGLAARLLASPDARVVALFGAGAQARSQLLALAAVRPVAEVRVVTRAPEHAVALLQWAAGRPELAGVRIEVRDPAAAVAGAQIVVTATSSPTPVFDGTLLGPGTHVTAVGAFSPDTRELDDAAMRGATIFVDQRDGALAEAGELRGLQADDVREIGAVVAGLAIGRSTPAERTVFKSVGNAIQDLVVAAAVYDQARVLGLGEQVAFP
ncbi:MAG TPA: ornithine cyclodeaminase family protein, partial [Candidatus Saccharimonadales bacterium]|nr:ornithine cyclodeaminase family protein [Candidatus Saccharimonadales bacterium]